MLTIRLFGPMEVMVDGQPLPSLRSRKTLWLLALLAMRHGGPVDREWLAATLWPDTDQETAFSNLRPTLSDLRRALGIEGARLMTPDRRRLFLDVGGADVDVIAFDEAITRSQQPDLEAAVAFYRGPLLEGCPEEWAPQERGAREHEYLQALKKLAGLAVGTGDFEKAIGLYRRAVSTDPWWDAVRRGLMDALAKSGDANEALRVYREFESLVRRESGAVPDEQTTELYGCIRAEMLRRARLPDLALVQERAASIVVGRLPHPLTAIVGREDERADVAAMLRRSRLVTLTGIGGVGKTRLAIEVANEVVQEFPGGVWLVGLESLSDPAGVLAQIADVFELREEPGRTLRSAVLERLRGERLLLVLDNCEHLLLPTSKIVEEFLRECGGLRVLATSREPFGIVGETAWEVPSLATPDPDHLPQGPSVIVRVLSGYDSVRLFVERAKDVSRSFSLNAANATTVAEICRELDGIPLAIELAAVRVKSMTVDQIAKRLSDRLTFLVSKQPALSFRQQTLRATLDWSHALLTESERRHLRRLSVFAGGWNLEAAQQICPDGLLEDQLLDLTGSLIDKSLVSFDQEDSGLGRRYRMAETVRQYAAEQLAASAEERLVLTRHFAWCVELAEEAEPQLTGPNQTSWLRRLEAEQANLTIALERREKLGMDSETGSRLGGALWRYWFVKGAFSEGCRRLEAVLEKDRTPSPARIKALNGLGALSYRLANYEAARERFLEAVGLARLLNNLANLAESLGNVGNVAYVQGDLEVAQECYEESLAICRQLGNKRGLALALGNLSHVAKVRHDYLMARTLLDEAIPILRELGDKQTLASALNSLGSLTKDQGDYSTARRMHEEGLQLFQELGDTLGASWSLYGLAVVAHSQGDFATAKTLHEENLAIRMQLQDRRGVAWSLNALGNVARDVQDYPLAVTRIDEALTIHEELGDKNGIVASLNGLAGTARLRGDLAIAEAHLRRSLTLSRELGHIEAILECLNEMAALFADQSKPLAACHLWGATEGLGRTMCLVLAPHDQERRDRQVEHVRLESDEGAFAAAWEEGRAMTWELALAYALGERSELESPIP